MKLDYKRMLREVDVKQAQLESDQASFERYAGLIVGKICKIFFGNAAMLYFIYPSFVVIIGAFYKKPAILMLFNLVSLAKK